MTADPMRDAAEIIDLALVDSGPYSFLATQTATIIAALLDGADRVALVRTVDGVKVVRMVPFESYVTAAYPDGSERCYHANYELCSVAHTSETIVAWADADGAR